VNDLDQEAKVSSLIDQRTGCWDFALIQAIFNGAEAK
jgi:hypothetical protein